GEVREPREAGALVRAELAGEFGRHLGVASFGLAPPLEEREVGGVAIEPADLAREALKRGRRGDARNQPLRVFVDHAARPLEELSEPLLDPREAAIREAHVALALLHGVEQRRERDRGLAVARL